MNLYDQDLTELFINEIPLVDLRSPGEFAEGSFPGAINLPLMSNEERHLVGICYKEKGQEEAIKLGHSLVSGNTKEDRINKWITFIKENPNAVFFCFRGGLRSQTVQKWLKEHNIDIQIIEGGYKALRNFLITKTDELSSKLNFLVLSGNTGSRKTEILNDLKTHSMIDLEGLANHRGSAFGYNFTSQPTQINFENNLAVEMLKIDRNQKSEFVLIEDESRRIGQLSIPNSFFEKKKISPVLLLKIDLDARTKSTRELYVEDLWKNSSYREESDFEGFKIVFSGPLERIKKKLGGENLKICLDFLDSAIEEQKSSGNFEKHDLWIKILLEKYYDPLYEKGVLRKNIIWTLQKSSK